MGGPPEGLRGRHTGRLRGAPCTCQRVQSRSNRPTRCRLDPYAARAGPRARPGRPQRPTPLPRARRPGRRPVREGGARAPRPVQHVPAVPAGAGVASEGARSWARSHPSAPGARTLESPPGADGGCAGSPGNLLRYSGCLGGTWNGSGMSPYMLSSPAYPDMMPVQPRSSRRLAPLVLPSLKEPLELDQNLHFRSDDKPRQIGAFFWRNGQGVL